MPSKKKDPQDRLAAYKYVSEARIINQNVNPEYVAKARLISVGTRYERLMACLERLMRDRNMTPQERASRMSVVKMQFDILNKYAESAKMLLKKLNKDGDIEDDPRLMPELSGTPSFPPAFPIKEQKPPIEPGNPWPALAQIPTETEPKTENSNQNNNQQQA